MLRPRSAESWPLAGDQHGNGARGDARALGIGAARQDDRHARAQHYAGRVGARQEGELLGKHIAGFEIGHDENIGLPRHLGDDPFLRGGGRADRVVEGERPVDQAAGDLAAVRHLAKRGGIERRAQFRD